MKNTSILTISNFSSKILIFLLVPIYTNYLTTEEYGLYDLALTTIQLLMPVLSLNIYDAVMRFLMDKDADEKQIAAVGIKFIVISIFAFTVITVCFTKLGQFSYVNEYGYYIVLYYLFNLSNQLLTQYAKGKENVFAVGVSGFLNTILTLILNIVLLVFVRAGLPGFYISYIAGQALSFFYLFWKVRFWKSIAWATNRELEKQMLMYSVPLILGTLGWWINNVSDRYIVVGICGVMANGIYSVAYKIPTILTTVQQIFLQAWQISAVKEYDGKKSKSFYGLTFAHINILMCFCCLILIIFTKPIAHLLYAKEFYNAWEFVPFLLVSVVFNSASGILGSILNANKNSRSLGISTAVGALTNIIFNIVLIKIMGVQGAAIATAISSFAIYAMRKKAASDEVEYKDYYKTIISWLLVVAQALIEIYTSLLWIEVLIFFLFIMVYKSEFVTYIKKAFSITNSIIHKKKNRD